MQNYQLFDEVDEVLQFDDEEVDDELYIVLIIIYQNQNIQQLYDHDEITVLLMNVVDAIDEIVVFEHQQHADDDEVELDIIVDVHDVHDEVEVELEWVEVADD